MRYPQFRISEWHLRTVCISAHSLFFVVPLPQPSEKGISNEENMVLLLGQVPVTPVWIFNWQFEFQKSEEPRIFNKSSIYALNKKDPDAIVYPAANGKLIRFTRNDFSSEEEFLAFPAWSDEKLP